MKRFRCLLLIILLLLCGCSGRNPVSRIEINAFSYEHDSAYYKDNPGVKESGFINTVQSTVDSAEKAVELAKKECTVEYDTVSVAYDSELKIYRVSFYKEAWLGGSQDVYMNQNGITLLIIYSE